MPMKKVEDRDRKAFYYRCSTCGHETKEKKKTKQNINERRHVAHAVESDGETGRT